MVASTTGGAKCFIALDTLGEQVDWYEYTRNLNTKDGRCEEKRWSQLLTEQS